MITTDAETTVPVAALRLPGGVLVDHWLTPSDWGDDWPSLTKIRIVVGGAPGESFAMIEQAPDARVFLGEDEIQRAITALSLALVALRGLDPLADA